MASTAPHEDRISKTTVKKAVNALLKWRKLHPKTTQKPPHLLEALEEEDISDKEDDNEEDFIYLLLTLKKIPPKDISKTPHKIALPNSLRSLLNSNLNLCLIIDDRPIKSPYKITAEFAQKKGKSEEIPVTKVLKLSKLKSDCKSFEGRRNLYLSYDMFLVDKRVISLLPGILGKQFYKRKRKIPVPLDLRGSANWKEQVERACCSVLLCLGSGNCSVLRVGRCGLNCGMESDEIVENVFAAVRGILEVVPKKWGGIRALHLKLSDSLALPIYDALPDSRLNVVEDGISQGGSEDRKNGNLVDKKMKGRRSTNVDEADDNEGEKIWNARVSIVETMGTKRKKEGNGNNKLRKKKK